MRQRSLMAAGACVDQLRPGWRIGSGAPSNAIIVPTIVIACDDRFAADVNLSRMLGGMTNDVCSAPVQ
jgi:hypothetical protein